MECPSCGATDLVWHPKCPECSEPLRPLEDIEETIKNLQASIHKLRDELHETSKQDDKLTVLENSIEDLKRQVEDLQTDEKVEVRLTDEVYDYLNRRVSDEVKYLNSRFTENIRLRDLTEQFELAKKFKEVIKSPKDVLILTLKPKFSFSEIAKIMKRLGFIPQTKSGVLKRYQRLIKRQKRLKESR